MSQFQLPAAEPVPLGSHPFSACTANKTADLSEPSAVLGIILITAIMSSTPGHVTSYQYLHVM
jgi:hypothetical protein